MLGVGQLFLRTVPIGTAPRNQFKIRAPDNKSDKKKGVESAKHWPNRLPQIPIPFYKPELCGEKPATSDYSKFIDK